MKGKGKLKKVNDTQEKKGTALKRKGKVVFDSDTFDVRIETTVEYVQRLCNKRQLDADVLNKAHDARLKLGNKQLELEKGVFNSKHNFMVHEETEHSKNYMALKAVLADLREEYPCTDPRRYGLDKEDLKQRIQQKLLYWDPVKQRYRAAQNLLHMRPPPLVINNNISTEELLKPIHERRIRRAALHLDTGRATSNDRHKTPFFPNIDSTGVTSNDRHAHLLLPNIASMSNNSAIETDGRGDGPLPKQTHEDLITPPITLNNNGIEDKQLMPNSKKNCVSTMFVTQEKLPSLKQKK